MKLVFSDRPSQNVTWILTLFTTIQRNNNNKILKNKVQLDANLRIPFFFFQVISMSCSCKRVYSLLYIWPVTFKLPVICYLCEFLTDLLTLAKHICSCSVGKPVLFYGPVPLCPHFTRMPCRSRHDSTPFTLSTRLATSTTNSYLEAAIYIARLNLIGQMSVHLAHG